VKEVNNDVCLKGIDYCIRWTCYFFLNAMDVISIFLKKQKTTTTVITVNNEDEDGDKYVIYVKMASLTSYVR